MFEALEGRRGTATKEMCKPTQLDVFRDCTYDESYVVNDKLYRPAVRKGGL